MTKKDRIAYARQLAADRAAGISPDDMALLEQMRQLRKRTYSSLGPSPRAVANGALMKAIDDLAGVITGDPEYFWAKPAREMTNGESSAGR